GPECGGGVAASRPDAGQRRAEVVVVGALAEQRPQVVPGASEQAGVELAVGRQPRTGAAAAKRLADRGDPAHPPLPVAVAIAVGDLAPIVRPDRLQGQLGVDAADDLGGGDDVVQAPAVGRAHGHVFDEPHDQACGAAAGARPAPPPLVVPTSMYSMTRTIRPLARAKRASWTRPWSLTPRLTTVFSLTGHNPAFWAAAMPSSTRARGTPLSFIARNTPSSSESRLTVTRDRPASRSARALPASSAPLVVNARSRIPSTAATMATSRSRSRRTSGSPPGGLPVVTPREAAAPTTRVISSNVRISARGRKAWSRPKISLGMQYGQGKLHRSVTETRRSRSGRPRRSPTPLGGSPPAGRLGSGGTTRPTPCTTPPPRAPPPQPN